MTVDLAENSYVYANSRLKNTFEGVFLGLTLDLSGLKTGWVRQSVCTTRIAPNLKLDQRGREGR